MHTNPIETLRNRRRSDDGFTLIELLVVVVILGILIGIAIPVYLSYRRGASDRSAQSDVRNAVAALELCNSDGGYPFMVPATGGLLTATANGCTQTITRSEATTYKYVVAPSGATTAAAVTSYMLVGNNANGATGTSAKYYCYNSLTGGGVRSVTGAADLAAATC